MHGRIAWLRRIAVTSVAMTLLLMVLGAWVKATGSGLSCPDWPTCYGEFLPPFPSYENGGVHDGKAIGYSQAQILYEWAHRAVVSLLAVPLLAFTVLSLKRGLHPALRTLPTAAAGMYLFQAFLGAVTVLVGNKPWATTAHMATATLFLTVQVIAMMFAFLQPLPPAKPVRPETPRPSVVAAPVVTARQGFVWENPAPVPVRPGDEGDHGA